MEAVMAKKRKGKKAAKKKKKRRAAKAKKKSLKKPAKKKSARRKAKPKKKAARKAAAKPAAPTVGTAAPTPSTAATPGARTALNPAAAWPFPTGSRPQVGLLRSVRGLAPRAEPQAFGNRRSYRRNSGRSIGRDSHERYRIEARIAGPISKTGGDTPSRPGFCWTGRHGDHPGSREGPVLRREPRARRGSRVDPLRWDGLGAREGRQCRQREIPGAYQLCFPQVPDCARRHRAVCGCRP